MKKFLYKNARHFRNEHTHFFTKQLFKFFKKNLYLNKKIRFFLKKSKQKNFRYYASTKLFNQCLLGYRTRNTFQKFNLNRITLNKLFLQHKIYNYLKI